MIKWLALLTALIPLAARAQQVAGSYAGRDGRVGTVVISCPSTDGSFTAGPCTFAKPGPVTYAAPAASSIATANTAVTVFPAGAVLTGCDFVNTGSSVLYLDFTATAVAGAPTAVPLQAGQSFHCPFAPVGAVSAVAAQTQAFVAIRY